MAPFDSTARPFRLGRMLRRLSIGSHSLHDESVARACLACPNKAACDAWLANDNPGFEPPIFCPNTGYLRMVKSESRRK